MTGYGIVRPIERQTLAEEGCPVFAPARVLEVVRVETGNGHIGEIEAAVDVCPGLPIVVVVRRCTEPVVVLATVPVERVVLVAIHRFSAGPTDHPVHAHGPHEGGW